MSNSRQALIENRANKAEGDTTNTSRTFGKISLNVYKPGFIDTESTEAMKMSIDRELGELSKALFQTAENTSKEIEDVVGDIDFTEIKEELVKLDVKVGENSAAITDEARVRADQDGALAERISNVKAESDAGIAQVTQTTTALSNSVGKLEAKWGVQVNVNNKIAGITLNNDGASSSFEVIADRFSISDGTNNTGAPFEVVNGQTKIKNAAVGTIQSDNWNGTNGWAIAKDGYAVFNNVTVRGHVEAASGSFTGNINAQSGVFRGDIYGENGYFKGTIYAKNLIGDVYSAAIISLPKIGEWINPGTPLSFRLANINSAEEFARTIDLAGATGFVEATGASAGQFSVYYRISVGGHVVLEETVTKTITTTNEVLFSPKSIAPVPAGVSGAVVLTIGNNYSVRPTIQRQGGEYKMSIFRASSVLTA